MSNIFGRIQRIQGYKNTDKDGTRLKNELKVRLMAPEACSEQGEKLVEIVAK